MLDVDVAEVAGIAPSVARRRLLVARCAMRVTFLPVLLAPLAATLLQFTTELDGADSEVVANGHRAPPATTDAGTVPGDLFVRCLDVYARALERLRELRGGSLDAPGAG